MLSPEEDIYNNPCLRLREHEEEGVERTRTKVPEKKMKDCEKLCSIPDPVTAITLTAATPACTESAQDWACAQSIINGEGHQGPYTSPLN